MLFAFSCAVSLQAQTKKQWEKAIEGMKEQKAQLEDSLRKYKACNDRIHNRKFITESPEQALIKWLVSCKDIKYLVYSNKFNEKPEFKEMPIAKNYLLLIEMHTSLSDDEGAYDSKQNEAFIAQLDSIGNQLRSMEPKHLDAFIQSFETLEECIRDYRTTMFELARILDVVAEMEKNKVDKAAIYSQLKQDNETYFVDKIPYTLNILQEYILGDQDKRNEIIKQLKESCLEAFKNFKI